MRGLGYSVWFCVILLAGMLLGACASPPIDPVSARRSITALDGQATDAALTALAAVDAWRHGAMTAAEAAARIADAHDRLVNAQNAFRHDNLPRNVADEAQHVLGRVLGLEQALTGLQAALSAEDSTLIESWSTRIRTLATGL